jgi:hypothetical protein
MDAIAGSVPLTLACHPQTPSQAIRDIDVVVGEATSGGLTLTFDLAGDIAGLRIPEPRSSRRAGALWRHTCFEVFIMAEDGPGYREFNFSPSGEWAVYAFRRYRDGGELEIELTPGIVVRRSMNRLQLDAEIRRDYLPPGRLLRLGLSAVMEDADGVLSYWALRHPPGRPDFHHTDAFASQLVLHCMRNLNHPSGGVRP